MIKVTIKVFLGICIALTTILISACGKPANVWYVEQGLETAWARILKEGGAPYTFRQIRTWEGGEIPVGQGILIARKPWQRGEKVTVYNRLPFTMEYNGAIVLALDPWMVFRKYTDPGLPVNRVYSGIGGDGVLLIPGKDPGSVKAWTARLIQGRPGEFPSDENIWREYENSVFRSNRFPNGAQTYTWSDVLFRLMGNETAWVYAPLSRIRGYPDFHKSILEAAPFPEWVVSKYSLQASILWAVPLGSGEETEKLAKTIEWLKKPETQTVIADNLKWIPANPYGKPFDPVSFTSHRHWLTATFVYEVND